MKTSVRTTTTLSKSVAKKLIVLAAANYLSSCSPGRPQIEELTVKIEDLTVKKEELTLDQLTDADRAEFEAWLNGPIAERR